MAKRIYRISELTGEAYTEAIKEAAQELNEAFHFTLDPKEASLVEETAEDFGLWFTENGELTVPEA